MPPASQTYLTASSGHMTTGWNSASSSFILASGGGVGKVPQVMAPEWKDGSTKQTIQRLIILQETN